MAALRKPTPSRDQADTAPPRAFEEMRDPLHPMHRDLLLRLNAQSSTDSDGLSRPARFAAIFYFGLATWGIIGLCVAGVVTLL